MPAGAGKPRPDDIRTDAETRRCLFCRQPLEDAQTEGLRQQRRQRRGELNDPGKQAARIQKLFPITGRTDGIRGQFLRLRACSPPALFHPAGVDHDPPDPRTQAIRAAQFVEMFQHENESRLCDILSRPVAAAQPARQLQNARCNETEKPLARLGIALPGMQDQTPVPRAAGIRSATQTRSFAIGHPDPFYHRISRS